jgi:hypothetical protein
MSFFNVTISAKIGLPNLLGAASSLFNSILGVIVSIDRLVLGNLEALATTFSVLLGAELRALKAAIFGIIPAALISIPALNLQSEIFGLVENLLPGSKEYIAKLAEIERVFGPAILLARGGYTLDSIVNLAVGTLLPGAVGSIASLIPNLVLDAAGAVSEIAGHIGMPISPVLKEASSFLPWQNPDAPAAYDGLTGIGADAFSRAEGDAMKVHADSYVAQRQAGHDQRTVRRQAADATATASSRARTGGQTYTPEQVRRAKGFLKKRAENYPEAFRRVAAPASSARARAHAGQAISAVEKAALVKEIGYDPTAGVTMARARELMRQRMLPTATKQ